MRLLYLLGLAVGLLAGCQTPPPTTGPTSHALWAIPASAANVDAWQAPSNLRHFSLTGDMQATERQHRALYYADNKGSTLEVHLRPLPGGWDDMPTERAVSAHLLQQQQHLMRRARLDGALAVSTFEESSRVPSYHDAPVHTLAFSAQHANTVWRHRMATTLLQPVFVSLVLRYPRGEEYTDAELQELLKNFAMANQQQWQAGQPKEP